MIIGYKYCYLYLGRDILFNQSRLTSGIFAMFGDMWYTPQFNAHSNRVSFNREICFLTAGTVSPLSKNLTKTSFNYSTKRYYVSPSYSPQELALEHINSGKAVDSLVINNILISKRV